MTEDLAEQAALGDARRQAADGACAWQCDQRVPHPPHALRTRGGRWAGCGGQMNAAVAREYQLAATGAPEAGPGETPPCAVCGLSGGHGALAHTVDADLAKLPRLDEGVRGSLAELARELARAMVAAGEDRPTPAQKGQLGQQLRATLQALTGVEGDDDAARKFFEIMSSPVWHGPDAGKADARPARRANRRSPR